MELRYLRLVRAIVEEGSIARAIDKLHLTPSALSHQLKEAETQLGAAIFYRINKKLVLTPVGEKVLQAAHRILADWQRTEAEIKEMMHGQQGIICLSVECFTSYHWLPEMMKRFGLAFPHVRFCLDVVNTEPIARLLSGGIDVVISYNQQPDPRLEYRELFNDEWLALVPAHHAWAGRPYVLPADFASETLIIYSPPLSTVRIYADWLQPAGVEPAVVTEVPITEAAIELVKAGMGVKVLPAWAARPYLQSGELVGLRLGPEGQYQRFYAARLRHQESPPYFDRFLDLLRQSILLQKDGVDDQLLLTDSHLGA